MQIDTSVRVTEDEIDQLKLVLGADVEAQLRDLGKAALREYIDVFLGLSTFKAAEAREQRLLLMILEAWNGRVPGDAEVGRLFNMTPTAARSLIRTVAARHRLRLAAALTVAASAAVRGAVEEVDGARRMLAEPVIVEHLNAILAGMDGRLKRIRLEPETGGQYLVPIDSYNALRGELER